MRCHESMLATNMQGPAPSNDIGIGGTSNEANEKVYAYSITHSISIEVNRSLCHANAKKNVIKHRLVFNRHLPLGCHWGPSNAGN